MSKLSTAFYSTTALCARPVLRNHISTPRNDRSGASVTKKDADRSSSVAIMMRKKIAVPPLTTASLKSIEGQSPQTITRHINRKYLQDTIKGGFRFGTIAGYKPADNAQGGRLGDLQEGSQRLVFSSRTGMYNGNFDGAAFQDVSIEGVESPIVIEYSVNDYCSCSSINGFRQDRANTLRARGNPDIDTFVVYDLEKLTKALREIFAENPMWQHFEILSRRVIYEEKDCHWSVEDEVAITEDRDHLEIWLDTSFVKSRAYEHEEEVRMLVIDPSKAGQLAEDIKLLPIQDPRIAGAVIEHGHF
ncbi:hypothetical protein [Pseudophaeobacter sp.]|uniref:hypothetical protein n=1 Tax=Pseudophaeobacter sp. TaxID=1971739 RepID=UPI0040589117